MQVDGCLRVGQFVKSIGSQEGGFHRCWMP